MEPVRRAIEKDKDLVLCLIKLKCFALIPFALRDFER